ncbi:Transcriptional corepressor LEUNIG [Sesamum alatum]|uniref:Transcriptional corepressor LEUNIG n=1 Tax=Sesamum alatum TaxID=300844 RepID=A0AAE1Y2H3_9LAMI|nr:Transcriptional corepressor LEUNIG [Sesamum alatum]
MMLMRAVEQQYQLLQQVQRPPQQWQQQQLEGGHVLISPVPAPAPATRKYDDRLKLSKQRDPLDDASMMTVQVHGTSSGSTVIGDASVSSSSRGNDQIGIKRKQPVSYSGTVKTTSFPSVSPSMPALPQSASSSVPHLSRDEADSQDIAALNPYVLTGISCYPALRLREVSSIDTSNSSTVISCHFSTDGKLLASGDHDRKAVLWYANTMEPKATLEGHLSLVTDVRFGPNIARLATSSSDKTVKIWDVNNPGSALCTFTGHSACVTSLDWHPNKDLICSCDANGEIRYWSISGGGCVAIFMVCDAVQVRFQPLVGRFLAAATPNAVLILDAETQTCCHSLEGHKEPIDTICWDHSGEVLACVSEISASIGPRPRLLPGKSLFF